MTCHEDPSSVIKPFFRHTRIIINESLKESFHQMFKSEFLMKTISGDPLDRIIQNEVKTSLSFRTFTSNVKVGIPLMCWTDFLLLKKPTK